MDDTDVLKIALFYFVYKVLNGRKEHCKIKFLLFNEIDEIDHFRNHPWSFFMDNDI